MSSPKNPGPRKAVAPHAWRRRDRVVGCISGNGEVLIRSSREVAIGSLERVVAIVRSRAAQICSRAQVAISAACVNHVAARPVVDRRPWEAGMPVQNAADLPAAGDLLHPVVAPEKRRVPDAEQLHVVTHVEIRHTFQVGKVEGILPDVVLVRSRVNRRRPSILSVNFERPREPMPDLSKKRVVIRVAVVAE